MNTMARKTGSPGQHAQARAAATDGGRRDASTASTSSPVTPDRIRGRAYEIYQARNDGGRPGDATSDWLQAERELNVAAPDPSASADIEVKAQSRGERLLAGAE